MNRAIKKMVESSDYEVAYMGENFSFHAEDYIAELKKLGFTRAEAESGIALYCESKALAVIQGLNVTFPDYRDDIVKELAQSCIKQMEYEIPLAG